jgi:hypothetical protein
MESLDVVNQRLIDHFGRAWNGIANWRIVWSEDQFEKRLTHYSDKGILLPFPEVRELPKYRQWIQNKWVLERYLVIPQTNQAELPSTQMSYEPVFVFEDKDSNALPYNWNVAKWVIETIYEQAAKMVGYAKYKHPLDGLNTKEQLLAKHDELVQLEKDTFGNETSIGDALAYREGVGYTGTIKES